MLGFACRVSKSSLCPPLRRQPPLRPPLPMSRLSTHSPTDSLISPFVCSPPPLHPPCARRVKARPLHLRLLGWRGRSTAAQRRGWSPDPRRGRCQDADPPLCRHEVRHRRSSSSRLPLFFTHLTVLPSLFPDPVKESPRARSGRWRPVTPISGGSGGCGSPSYVGVDWFRREKVD